MHTTNPAELGRSAISRRSLLLGSAGVAGVAMLAACSKSSGGQTATTAPGAGASATSKAAGLLAIFDTQGTFGRAGVPQRFAFAVAGQDGVPSADAPEKLDFTITQNGKPIGSPLTVARHADGVPIAYYPLRFTPEQPGTYQALVTLNGKQATAAFMVGTAAQVKVPQVGESLIPVDTPTTTDHRGVEPICTRKPQACPLHDTSLTDLMKAGKPIAFMVSTPQFCQIGVCGPVLELLVEQHQQRPEINMVHAEVYKNATGGNIQSADLADAPSKYNLTYEPALFVAKPDGTIVDRLDNVFDRSEIAAALQKATG